MPSSAPIANVRLSVCIAAYNGEKFIREQINSILCQLDDADELIIVDDCSSDATVAVVSELDDSRILLFQHDSNRGYVRTFADALVKARGEYVLLSDQDDVWPDGRVATMVSALETASVVAGNLKLFERGGFIQKPVGGGDWLLPAQSNSSPVSNVLKILTGSIPYFGSAMGVRGDFLREKVLPLPAWLYESHDLWLGIVANVAGTIKHIPEAVTFRRLHDNNASPNKPRGITSVVRSRVLVLRMISAAFKRKK